MIITNSNLILHRPLDIEDGYMYHIAIYHIAITRAQAQKSSTEETGAGASNTDLPLKDHLEEEQDGDGGMEESNTDSPPSSDDHPTGAVGTDPKEPYSIEGSTEVAEEGSNTDSPPTGHFEI